MLQSWRCIQVTSASAENGSRHWGSTRGRRRPGCRLAWKAECVFACARLMGGWVGVEDESERVGLLLCALAGGACALTLTLCDRMITPSSPQLQGVSRVPSSSSSKGGTSSSHMSKLVSCGQQCSFWGPTSTSSSCSSPPPLPKTNCAS